MENNQRSEFWDDLNKDLEDPEFRRLYQEESERIRIYDEDMNKKLIKREGIFYTMDDGLLQFLLALTIVLTIALVGICTAVIMAL